MTKEEQIGPLLAQGDVFDVLLVSPSPQAMLALERLDGGFGLGPEQAVERLHAEGTLHGPDVGAGHGPAIGRLRGENP